MLFEVHTHVQYEHSVWNQSTLRTQRLGGWGEKNKKKQERKRIYDAGESDSSLSFYVIWLWKSQGWITYNREKGVKKKVRWNGGWYILLHAGKCGEMQQEKCFFCVFFDSREGFKSDALKQCSKVLETSKHFHVATRERPVRACLSCKHYKLDFALQCLQDNQLQRSVL